MASGSLDVPSKVLLVAIEESSQIRDSRPYLQDGLPDWRFQLHALRHFRARSHQAHVSLQHIEKLG